MDDDGVERPGHTVVVVRKGATADAMFFIMAGEVEVDVEPVRRGAGRGLTRPARAC